MLHPRAYQSTDLSRDLIHVPYPQQMCPQSSSQMDSPTGMENVQTASRCLRGRAGNVWSGTLLVLIRSPLVTLPIHQGRPGQTESAKTLKYAELQDRFHFVPIGFETFGPWGKSATTLVADIARRIVERTGEPRSMEFLRQRLSIEIQRGNAVSVLGTTDVPKGSDDVFFLLGCDTVNC